MSAAVTIRPEVWPDDERLLLTIYDATRRPELEVLGWPDAEVDAFIRMQFDAQSRHYRSWYPHASFSVILAGGDPVGRLVLDRSATDLLIVDLALLPVFQRAGIGSSVVRRVLDEARVTGRSVRCQVELGNPARAFWEHLGFIARGMNGAHVAMECDARPV